MPGKRTRSESLAPVQRSPSARAPASVHAADNALDGFEAPSPDGEPVSFLDSLLGAPVQRKGVARTEVAGDIGALCESVPSPESPHSTHDSVQRSASGRNDVAVDDRDASTSNDVHAADARGIQSPVERLPFHDQIQASFGPDHDVSRVQTHVGGAATEAAAAMGASAYATGDHVAFARSPDLHLAAHEAAHVVQQRSGVSLKAGVGEASDPYEQHADQVADQVVKGHSAHALLDELAGSALRPSIQRKAASVPERGYDKSGAETVGLDFHRIWGFAVDSAELPPTASATLDLAANITKAGRLTTMEVDAHTSSSGSERNNQALSDERAHQTVVALKSRGVSADRLLARGFGEEQLLLREDGDAATMARNRRVELRIMNIDQDALRPEPPPAPAGSSQPAEPEAEEYEEGKGLGCQDTKYELRKAKVEKAAWNYFMQSGGRNVRGGIKDPGGNQMAPEYVWIMQAAKENQFYEKHHWEYFASIIKLPLDANLHAHIMDIDRQIAKFTSDLKNSQGCDEYAPMGITIDEIMKMEEAAEKRRRNRPDADTAPGGQKY